MVKQRASLFWAGLVGAGVIGARYFNYGSHWVVYALLPNGYYSREISIQAVLTTGFVAFHGDALVTTFPWWNSQPDSAPWGVMVEFPGIEAGH